MNLPFFLSKKIYGSSEEKQKVSRPAIRIATLGVAIGVVVMLVSVAVVLGFKHTIRDKVSGFGGHIQVANFMTQQTSEQYPVVVNDSLLTVLKNIPGVRHAERYASTQGILKTNTDFLGVTIKGVAEEWDSAFIHKNLIEGSIPKFSSKESTGKILVSQQIANKLKLKVGDKIFAYFLNNDGVRTRRFTINGIYETNLSQYDKVVCFADLYTTVKLNGWEADEALGAEVIVDDFNNVDIVEEDVVAKVNRTIDKYGNTYTSKTIKELNPQIFAWLDLLDMNVWIILALMTLVAGVTMTSGLLIIILERAAMIGTLKALGARGTTIQKTFLWFGAFIVGKGMVWGNIAALTLMILQQQLGIIKLDAQTYYVDTVPIEINIPAIIIINVATLVVSILVMIIPSFLISHIKPVKAIKFE